MRELNTLEIENIKGGFVFAVPPVVKFVAWVGGAAAAGYGAYMGESHGSFFAG